MTQSEFEDLKVGDTVYFYRKVNPMKLGTVTAALVKKTIGSIHTRDNGDRSIGLERGGVILSSLLHIFDTDKDKLLYQKLKEIKKVVKESINGPHRFKQFPSGLKWKYDSILQQKNIQSMLKKYPELLI